MVFPFDFEEKENEIVFIEALEYAVPMFDGDGAHQSDVSLHHHNQVPAPDANRTVNDVAEEFITNESLLVEAPAFYDDEAHQDPIPALDEERADNEAKNNFAKAVKKSSKEWKKTSDPRARHIRYLLRQLSKKITESKKKEKAHFEPMAILNKLSEYRPMEFEFPHNNGVFELIVNKISHSYKGLANTYTVFQDETGSCNCVPALFIENSNFNLLL